MRRGWRRFDGKLRLAGRAGPRGGRSSAVRSAGSRLRSIARPADWTRVIVAIASGLLATLAIRDAAVGLRSFRPSRRRFRVLESGNVAPARDGPRYGLPTGGLCYCPGLQASPKSACVRSERADLRCRSTWTGWAGCERTSSERCIPGLPKSRPGEDACARLSWRNPLTAVPQAA
jgi:hypothetical protein